MKDKYIGVDFDGTCVTHSFPNMGRDTGAIPVLKKLVKEGHKLILFTMRSDKYLEDAVNWFKDNEIPLFGINENPIQKIWTTSPKAYAHIYIDDAALGCPLIYPGVITERPYVDWVQVEKWMVDEGYLRE